MTNLSKAGACNNNKDPTRIEKGFQAARFFNFFLDADCPRICVENPIPQKRFNLPPAQHRVQPWEFGHSFSKFTYLWLKGLPPLLPTCLVGNYIPYLNTTGYAKTRSKTFIGIAKAMADQWYYDK